MVIASSRIRDQSNIFLIIILLLVITCISLIFEVDRRVNPSENSIILAACTVITAFVGVCGVVVFFFQWERSRKLNQAQFIVNLYSGFMSNCAIVELYSKLEDPKKTIDIEDKVRMTAYLSYFEMIHILLKDNILSIKEVNDLFAYQFFLAVHDKRVQEIELKRDAVYYPEIFKLHNKLLIYRINHDMPVMNIENSLEITCEKEYQNICGDEAIFGIKKSIQEQTHGYEQG